MKTLHNPLGTPLILPTQPQQGTTRHRAYLTEKTGHVMAPYFIDPNTETAMYESRDIIAYLHKTYALSGAGAKAD